MRRNAALVWAFAEVVAEHELDAVAYPHPISGPFTMRQGFEFIRFHLDRHRDHLLESRTVGKLLIKQVDEADAKPPSDR
jgi:hypothetical protein